MIRPWITGTGVLGAALSSAYVTHLVFDKSVWFAFLYPVSILFGIFMWLVAYNIDELWRVHQRSKKRKSEGGTR